MWRSVPQMLAASTRTRTSSSAIEGTGTSTRSSPGSARSFRTAHMVDSTTPIYVVPATLDRMSQLSSLEIAQAAKLPPSTEAATAAGIEEDELEPYGRYKGKV